MDQAWAECQQFAFSRACGTAVSPEVLCPLEGEVPRPEDPVSGLGSGGAEATTSKSMGAPARPSRAEIEAHEVSHLPFWDWCACCVRGRAAAQQHKAVEKETETLSTYSADYGFFGMPGQTPLESVAGKDLPVIVSYDRGMKAPFAHTVPSLSLIHI